MREARKAAGPMPSIVDKMFGYVGEECDRWQHHYSEVQPDDNQTLDRARRLQGLRKSYLTALAAEQRRNVPSASAFGSVPTLPPTPRAAQTGRSRTRSWIEAGIGAGGGSVQSARGSARASVVRFAHAGKAMSARGPGKFGGSLARLPKPPPTPSRVLQPQSYHDAALLNAFERSEAFRNTSEQQRQADERVRKAQMAASEAAYQASLPFRIPRPRRPFH